MVKVMEKKQAGRTSQGGTALVCPKDFLQSWNVEAMEAVNVKVKSEEQKQDNIARKMGVSDDTVKELAEVCGVESLLTGLEPKGRLTLLDMIEGIPPKAEIQLESLRHQINQRKRRVENPSLRSALARQMKYNFWDEYMAIKPPEPEAPVKKEDQVPVPNVVLTVQIIRCLKTGESSTKSRELEVMNVLGSQTLAQLKDRIRCASDAAVAGEYSSMPDSDAHTLQKAGDLYKSSFFFIENVFYNDTRLIDNKDYSKPIIQWAKEQCDITDYTTDKMEDTTFSDLKIRLGHHYLYFHQGNCEHSIMFTDMRLFTAEDPQDINEYPQLCIARMKNRAVCQSCLKFSCRWIVRESLLTPSDPCYLCKPCFKKLLYDKQGKKISNFKAYHLTDFYTTSQP